MLSFPHLQNEGNKSLALSISLGSGAHSRSLRLCKCPDNCKGVMLTPWHSGTPAPVPWSWLYYQLACCLGEGRSSLSPLPLLECHPTAAVDHPWCWGSHGTLGGRPPLPRLRLPAYSEAGDTEARCAPRVYVNMENGGYDVGQHFPRSLEDLWGRFHEP